MSVKKQKEKGIIDDEKVNNDLNSQLKSKAIEKSALKKILDHLEKDLNK